MCLYYPFSILGPLNISPEIFNAFCVCVLSQPPPFRRFMQKPSMATKQSLSVLKDINFNPKTSGKVEFVLRVTASVLSLKLFDEVHEVLSSVCAGTVALGPNGSLKSLRGRLSLRGCSRSRCIIMKMAMCNWSATRTFKSLSPFL